MPVSSAICQPVLRLFPVVTRRAYRDTLLGCRRPRKAPNVEQRSRNFPTTLLLTDIRYARMGKCVLHSVIETPMFLTDAKAAGMDADEREAVVLFLSVNPQAGDVMAGTGGARKFRFKRPGTGKRGGYRIVFYHAGQDIPLFLLNVFTKGDRANLSDAEQNKLRAILSVMADTYRKGPRK